MGIVCGDHKAVRKCHQIFLVCPSKPAVDTEKCVFEEGGCRSLLRAASDFFIVKDTVHRNAVLLLCAQKALQRGKSALQVVQSGAGCKFVLCAPYGAFHAVVKKKIMSMFTDPNHLRVQDPGRVEGNPVFIYLEAFCKDEYFPEFLPEYQNLEELEDHYRRGGLGDVKVKKFLNNVMQAELSPIRARRKEWEQRIPDVMDILREGSRVAEAKAAETLNDVKASMRINYFDSDQSDMYQK